jgi:hypothetical protein
MAPFLGAMGVANAGLASALGGGGGFMSGLSGALGGLGGILGGIGGLGQMFGGLFGGSQEKARRAQTEQLNQILREMRARKGSAALRAQEAKKIQETRLAKAEAMYDRAEAETRGAGRKAMQDVGQSARQAGSVTTQNMMTRGMIGSSGERNAQRGIAADAARINAGIQTGVGNAIGGINMNRANLTSAIQGDMARIPWLQAELEAGASQAQTDFLSRIQHTSSGPGLGSIGGIGNLLTGLGGFFGEGGGFDSIRGGFTNLFGKKG